MVKILTIFGTRPELIKLAPLIIKLRENRYFKSKTCATAQHRQMLDQMLDIFKIKPDFDLNIMQESQDLYHIVASAVIKLKSVIKEENPSMIIVQGDTSTAFIASLVAFYSKIKVAHVEAGLRTNDKYSPFPEEINRRLISAVSDLHFAPTKNAQLNLLRENVDKKNIFVTGNTVVDALKMALKARFVLNKSFWGRIERNKRIVLVTAHRRESFGKPLEEICLALKNIASNQDVFLVYPVHLNPNVKNTAYRILGRQRNVLLTAPLDYLNFVHLMYKSYLVLTDSGGIQEEASCLGKPVLILREVTERPEILRAGIARLVGTDRKKIIYWASRLITDQILYKRMSRITQVYGDGRASEKILNIILKRLKG